MEPAFKHMKLTTNVDRESASQTEVPYINELRRQIKEIIDTKYNKDEEDSCPVDHSNRIKENDVSSTLLPSEQKI